MWFAATVAASLLENPDESRVVGDVGYAPAPTGVDGLPSGWLYSWALAIPRTTAEKGPEQVDATWKFLSWMTSKPYQRMVGEELGWTSVPPGARQSTYAIPEYIEASKAYAPQTRAAIDAANQDRPTPIDTVNGTDRSMACPIALVTISRTFSSSPLATSRMSSS